MFGVSHPQAAAMALAEKKGGLLRKSSASKKPLKEKVVLMYDEIFTVRGRWVLVKQLSVQAELLGGGPSWGLAQLWEGWTLSTPVPGSRVGSSDWLWQLTGSHGNVLLFQIDDPSKRNPRFWEELFLMKVMAGGTLAPVPWGFPRAWQVWLPQLFPFPSSPQQLGKCICHEPGRVLGARGVS